MRAGFHTIKKALSIELAYKKESQSLVNEGRFPLIRKSKRDGIITLSRNPSLMRAGFHFFSRSGEVIPREKVMSQSLVNEGRFPHGCDVYLFKFRGKLSQSLVNEGRFPLKRRWGS